MLFTRTTSRLGHPGRRHYPRNGATSHAKPGRAGPGRSQLSHLARSHLPAYTRRELRHLEARHSNDDAQSTRRR